VTLDAEPLLYLAEDRSGMGQSGETIIVTRDEDGLYRALHRTRPGGPDAWDPIQTTGPNDLAEMAISGGDSVYWQGIKDYRGVAVWAAVRRIPEAGMGLVVKVDEDEGRAPITQFRRRTVRLGLSLGAFAILFGTILGFRFSKPVLELAGVADRIREGA